MSQPARQPVMVVELPSPDIFGVARGHDLLRTDQLFAIAMGYVATLQIHPHVHPYYQLTILEGAQGGWMTIAGRRHRMAPLEMALVAPGVSHAWMVDADQAGPSRRVKEISVALNPVLFHNPFTSYPTFQAISSLATLAEEGVVFTQEAARKAIRWLERVFKVSDPSWQLPILVGLFIELAGEDHHLVPVTTPTPAPMRQEYLEDTRVAAVQGFVRVNFRREIRLEELARLADMSEPGLSRLYGALTGQTIQEYILTVRTTYAGALLACTSMSVAEVNAASGFNNISNFNRIFRKYKGMSPMEFRRKYTFRIVAV